MRSPSVRLLHSAAATLAVLRLSHATFVEMTD
jgi:hypothetical protein